MSLIEEINLLADISGLTEQEKRELENFVDNYVGTAKEDYIPNKEYYELHKSAIKPIWRKLKDCSRFGTLINILRPHVNAGVLAILD